MGKGRSREPPRPFVHSGRQGHQPHNAELEARAGAMCPQPWCPALRPHVPPLTTPGLLRGAGAPEKLGLNSWGPNRDWLGHLKHVTILLQLLRDAVCCHLLTQPKALPRGGKRRRGTQGCAFSGGVGGGGCAAPKGVGSGRGHSRTASPYPWEGPEEGGQRDQSSAGLPTGRPAIHGPEPPALLPESLPPTSLPVWGHLGRGETWASAFRRAYGSGDSVWR